jgi:tetratricopeptide (TPR) repeat protein
MTTLAISQGVGMGRGGVATGYVVAGKVILPDGRPAVGAQVEGQCDFYGSKTTTGADGSYRLDSLRAGNCTFTARIEGMEPMTESRTIERDAPYGSTLQVSFFFKKGAGANPALAGIAQPAQDKYKAAQEKIAKKKNDDALKLLDEAIVADPKFAAAYYEKGQLLLEKSDVDNAMAALVKAIELQPNYIEAKYAFGRAQLAKKNYDAAEGVFRDVLTAGINTGDVHLNLGIALFYLKRVDDAEAELKAASTAKGGEKLALPHLYLGQIYASRKLNKEAITELEKYIELAPKAPNVDHIRTAIDNLKKQG